MEALNEQFDKIRKVILLYFADFNSLDSSTYTETQSSLYIVSIYQEQKS